MDGKAQETKSQLTLQQLSEFFTEYWKMVKDFYDSYEPTEDVWMNLKVETDRLDRKYRSKYFRDLLVAYLKNINEVVSHGGTTN